MVMEGGQGKREKGAGCVGKFVSISCRSLTFTLVYQPLTLFKFNLYASMSRENPWTQFMGGTDPTDENQDTIKVCLWQLHCLLT